MFKIIIAMYVDYREQRRRKKNGKLNATSGSPTTREVILYCLHAAHSQFRALYTYLSIVNAAIADKDMYSYFFFFSLRMLL